MELPDLDTAQSNQVMVTDNDYEIRFATFGPDQLGPEVEHFIGILFAVLAKQEMIVMLRLHMADSVSILEGWANRTLSERDDWTAEIMRTVNDPNARRGVGGDDDSAE